MDYGLTAMLLKAAARRVKPRFVYLSVAGANKPGMSAYSRARYKTEKAVVQSGMPYTIALLFFIIGPDRDDRRMGEIFGARFLDGLLVLAGALAQKRCATVTTPPATPFSHRRWVRLSLDPGRGNAVVESENLRH